MKPIIILPPKLMSEEHIKLLRDNDLCVVVAEDPAKIRFLDPIPAQSQRGKIEQAAILLSKIVLNRQWGNYTADNTIGSATAARIFFDILCKGTDLDPSPSQAQRETEAYDDARIDEIKRIAREDAKAMRAAQKKAEEEAKAAAEAKLKALKKP